MPKDTNERLIDAAVELLDRGGPPAVTLREVGKLAGVSHNAPYRHFADKEDLLAAVATRELRKQAASMSAARKMRSTRLALRTAVREYFDWARIYPARFALVFGSWSKPNSELREAARYTLSLLVEIVRKGQDQGELPRAKPERLAALIHAVAHGSAALEFSSHSSGRSKMASSPEVLLDDLLRYLSRPG